MEKNKAKKSFKEIIFEVFYDNKGRSWYHLIDDYLISSLIALNVIAILLASFDSLHTRFENYFNVFEIISVVIFTIEYILRLWVADMYYSRKKGKQYHPLRAKIKYMFSFYGVVDLWAILPFYLPLMITLDLRSLRMLRLLRIFRVFKLVNYSKSMRIIADVMREKKSDLIVTMSVTAIILLLASTFMYEIEHSVQPDQFPNIFSTIWWAVATLTTIGYGDVYPITALGRLLAGITAVLGIGIVAIPTGIISAGFMEKFQQQTDKTNVIEEEPKEATKTYYCPKCGTIFTVLDEDEPQKP